MANLGYVDESILELKFIMLVDPGQVNWHDLEPYMRELYDQGVVVLRVRRAMWCQDEAIRVYFGSEEGIKGIEELKKIIETVELEQKEI